MEGLPGQAFTVHPDQEIVGAFDVADCDREVLLVPIELAIHDHSKRPKARRQVSLRVPLHRRCVFA